MPIVVSDPESSAARKLSEVALSVARLMGVAAPA